MIPSVTRESGPSRKHTVTKKKPLIAFVGVWDTVIRYGPLLAPFRFFAEKARREHFGLMDHVIPSFVKHVCHALALDEQRSAFWPWRAELQGAALPGQVVNEVWFAGSHSDVGGGYKNLRLSRFSLRWMCECAAAEGLKFRHLPAVGKNSYLAPLNPSRVTYWRFLPSRRRIVEDLDSFHVSVEQRIRGSRYRPAAKVPVEMLKRLMSSQASN